MFGILHQDQNGCVELSIPLYSPYNTAQVCQYYTLYNLPSSYPPVGSWVTDRAAIFGFQPRLPVRHFLPMQLHQRLFNHIRSRNILHVLNLCFSMVFMMSVLDTIPTIRRGSVLSTIVTLPVFDVYIKSRIFCSLSSGYATL